MYGLLVILVLFSLFFLCRGPQQSHGGAYGLIIAHRGASGLAPENTLAAVRKAVELGADMIEIDLRQTRDSVVVIHDDTIDRTTNGHGEVGKMSFADIRDFDSGSWFDEAFSGEKIPTLREVISAVNGRCKLLLEIKGDEKKYPGICGRILRQIDACNAKEWIVIQSFSDQVLESINRIDSTVTLHKLLIVDVPVLPVYIDSMVRFGRAARNCRIDAFNLHSAFITRDLISRLHRNDFRINVWVVNDSLEIERYFRMGVDGVITDFPNYKRISK
jgi:glycerophosphoryl diester phosphodiesterase